MTNPFDPTWRPVDQAFAFIRERDLGDVLEKGIPLGGGDFMAVFETEEDARKAGLAILGDAHSLLEFDLNEITNATFDSNPFEQGTYVTPIAGRLTYMTSTVPPEAISEVPRAKLGL